MPIYFAISDDLDIVGECVLKNTMQHYKQNVTITIVYFRVSSPFKFVFSRSMIRVVSALHHIVARSKESLAFSYET